MAPLEEHRRGDGAADTAAVETLRIQLRPASNRFKRVNEAEGDVAAFSAVLQQYVKAAEITRTRLYLETMSEILPTDPKKRPAKPDPVIFSVKI
jgi:regulator of protease activity HflC (stomatin/prohibitin superfamily)